MALAQGKVSTVDQKPYFSFPENSPRKKRDIKAFAHRGSDPERENTLVAFQNAYDLGYRYFETDVHTTKCGQLVCFHDPILDRVSDATGLVSQHSWRDLDKVRVGGEPLLLFEDLLKEFPDVRVNVDMKDRSSPKLIGDVLRKTDSADRVLVSAFEDVHRISFFRAYPEYQGVVASSAGKKTLTALYAASRVAAFGFGRSLRKIMHSDAAQIPQFYNTINVADERFIAYCHTIGMEVHVWTINDTETMEELVALGVDGIMTDDGPALASVLDHHGQWPQ